MSLVSKTRSRSLGLLVCLPWRVVEAETKVSSVILLFGLRLGVTIPFVGRVGPDDPLDELPDDPLDWKVCCGFTTGIDKIEELEFVFFRSNYYSKNFDPNCAKLNLDHSKNYRLVSDTVCRSLTKDFEARTRNFSWNQPYFVTNY